MNDIQQIIEKSDNFEELESQIYLLKGQSELELGLYHDAIITLSEAIKKDSKNKDIYIDRAQAYFELGKFDLAIQDYVLSDLKVTPIDEKNISSLDFSKGLIFGIIKGGKDGAEEFVPSALASLHGLGPWVVGICIKAYRLFQRNDISLSKLYKICERKYFYRFNKRISAGAKNSY